MTKLRVLRRGMTMLVVAMAATTLVGCASVTLFDIPARSIAAVAKLKSKVMSKDERDSTIRDLSMAQETHREDAVEEIEKR